MRLMDVASITRLAEQWDLETERISSFALQRHFGRCFNYNETVTIATVTPR